MRAVADRPGICLLLASLFVAGTTNAVCQEPVDSPRCRQAARLLLEGAQGESEQALHDALACGDVGIEAVAKAITLASTRPATDRRTLVVVAGLMRNDKVFDAALAVVRGSKVAFPVWSDALMILARQLQPDVALGYDEAGMCRLGWETEHLGTEAQGQLSPDRPERLSDALRAVSHDREAEPRTRALARCVATQIGFTLPPDVQVGDLHVEVLCGRRIRIRSAAPEAGIVEVHEGTSGRAWKLNIAPAQVREFSVENDGAVEIRLSERVVWRGMTGESPCPS